MILTQYSTSPEDTFNLGKTIGSQLKGNELILLHGDLGAGKTLFTKGIAESLNINAQEVVSPTFTLMNHFPGKTPLYHFDLYRLGEIKNNSLPEVDDLLGDGIIIIEWAQFLSSIYATLNNTVNVYFNIISEENREIKIVSNLSYLSESIHASGGQKPF